MEMKSRASLFAATSMLGAVAAAQPGPPPAAPPGASYGAPPSVAAPSVRSGIEAWQAGNYLLAIGNWRPLADRGDADAQYNLAQAYFLGRGVPENANLAEQWYERAARQGHQEAQANYGLLLFQNGRRQEAMPWIQRAADRGDPRAQYVLGTALFNGDLIAPDLPRAYALMSRAAAAGLPPAISQLQAIEPHLTAEERARGDALASTLPAAPPSTQLAAGPVIHPAPARAAASAPIRPIRTAITEPHPPAPRPIHAPPAPARPSADRPAAEPGRIAVHNPAPAPGGRWRIQLGAFSSEANARRAWGGFSGRLAGVQPVIVHAGPVFRLQAGPFAGRAAAQQACGRVGGGCFPVAP